MAIHLPLLVWLSPSFPVGAFAYSHGLEWAHEAGDLVDAPSLTEWLHDLLAFGSARNDCLLFAQAYRAAQGGEGMRLSEVAELAIALASSAERRLETITTGDAFLIAAANAWPCPALDLLRQAVPGPVPYPVAVGTVAAGHRIPLADALPAYALGFVANLVSAAVRLGILAQTDGQRTIAALMPGIEAAAAFALAGTLHDVGGAAFRSDLAALRHETQYTRLFRS